MKLEAECVSFISCSFFFRFYVTHFQLLLLLSSARNELECRGAFDFCCRPKIRLTRLLFYALAFHKRHRLQLIRS